MEDVLSKLKEGNIDLIISDLDDTLVKNIAVSFFKHNFRKHPLKNLAFLVNVFYELLKYEDDISNSFLDFGVGLFNYYVDKYSSLDEVVDFVYTNKKNLILKDAQDFLSYFPNTKKVLITSDFKEVAELFKEDFQLDEIYAEVDYKSEAVRDIVNSHYRSILILGNSFKDLAVILELERMGFNLFSIFRSRNPEMKRYVTLQIRSFYSLF